MTRTIESLCWLGCASGLLVAFLVLRTLALATATRILPVGAPASPSQQNVGLDSLTNDIIQRDPFRLARRPSQVPFIADTVAAAVSTAPKAPAPPLVLAGIVGGPPWSAVIEGVPGRDGPVVVHRGDTLAGLRIRDVRRDRAIVSSPDTTWVLTIKRVWQ